jgi:hypothetical protein
LINPAKTHPEVIVQAIAARDRTKAEKFAKANGIPEVKASYKGNHPSTFCVWQLRSWCADRPQNSSMTPVSTAF